MEESRMIFKRSFFFLKFATGAEWEQEMTANERFFKQLKGFKTGL